MFLQLDCQLDFVYVFFVFQGFMPNKKLGELLYEVPSALVHILYKHSLVIIVEFILQHFVGLLPKI